MLLDPSPCHKLSQLLGPPLERDVLYGRPQSVQSIEANFVGINSVVSSFSLISPVCLTSSSYDVHVLHKTCQQLHNNLVLPTRPSHLRR